MATTVVFLHHATLADGSIYTPGDIATINDAEAATLLWNYRARLSVGEEQPSGADPHPQYTQRTELHAVAFSGDFVDLENVPSGGAALDPNDPAVLVIASE